MILDEVQQYNADIVSLQVAVFLGIVFFACTSLLGLCLQCFDNVGWASGTASSP